MTTETGMKITLNNNTEILETSNASIKGYDLTRELKAGDVLGVACPNTGKLYSISITIIENPVAKYKAIPKNLKSIGEMGYTTLYGINHLDNKFIGGIMFDTSENAVTGEITLGNAVGYIKVNYNGQIIKIPYYN